MNLSVIDCQVLVIDMGGEGCGKEGGGVLAGLGGEGLVLT